MGIEGEFTRMVTGSDREKMYFNVNDKTGEVWIDIKYLPSTCFLCAVVDGVSIMTEEIGKRKNGYRTFLQMDWLINEWGGPKDLVDALKKCRKKFKKDWKKMILEEHGNK